MTCEELKYVTALVKSMNRIKSREGIGHVVLNVPIAYVPTEQYGMVEEKESPEYCITWVKCVG